LKRVCEDLIADCSDQATKPLQIFLDRCTGFLAARAGRDLPSQEWASRDKVMIVHDSFRAAVESAVKDWRALLMLYLQDEETVKVLFPPLQVRPVNCHHTDKRQASIAEVYRQFHDVIRAEFDFETAATIMTPSSAWSLLEQTT
jgi:hypothetical protein